jgi:hypothetical protein
MLRRPQIPVRLVLAALALPALLLGQPVSPAQPSGPAPVEVRQVRFSYPRVPGFNSPAMEMEVDLTVRATGAESRNSRFVDRVRATVSIAVEARGRGAVELVYYQAVAEAVTLETGRAIFRFYLPPEVVRRDQLSGEPLAWVVDLAAADRVLPPARGAVSDRVRDAERLANFRQRVAENAPANDGILVPSYRFRDGTLAPDAPTFVRRGPR